MEFISPGRFINVDPKALERGPAIHTGELNTIYATPPDLPLALVETEGLTVGRQLATQPGLTSMSWILSDPLYHKVTPTQRRSTGTWKRVYFNQEHHGESHR